MRQRRCTSTSQKSAHMRRTEWFIYVAILFLLLACLPFWLLHLRPTQSRALTNPPAQSLYWIEADLAERPQGAVEEVNRRVMTYDCSDGAPRTFAGLDDASKWAFVQADTAGILLCKQAPGETAVSLVPLDDNGRVCACVPVQAPYSIERVLALRGDMLFAVLALTENQEPTFQFARCDLSTRQWVLYGPLLDFIGMPSVSTAGEIVDARDARLYLLGLDGNERPLEQGYAAQWLPNTSARVLFSDASGALCTMDLQTRSTLLLTDQKARPLSLQQQNFRAHARALTNKHTHLAYLCTSTHTPFQQDLWHIELRVLDLRTGEEALIAREAGGCLQGNTLCWK